MSAFFNRFTKRLKYTKLQFKSIVLRPFCDFWCDSRKTNHFSLRKLTAIGNQSEFNLLACSLNHNCDRRVRMTLNCIDHLLPSLNRLSIDLQHGITDL
ncbi:Uncharacterised protein [Vibrio cholerae]|nr:Uncharacterised protein [Vibrio cholerae]CSC15318.1 Uncharacterised protein [Vibrio cholerae]